MIRNAAGSGTRKSLLSCAVMPAVETITESQTNRLPRPEYPRPQFVRRQWNNLNGEWEFALDDADQGRVQNWQDGRTLDSRIVVPFPYQCEFSGVNDKAIHEVVWYARSFEIPEDWAGQDVLLHFGAVDYHTTVWVNGEEVGNNRGGHVPFSFDIRPYLRAGGNRLPDGITNSLIPGKIPMETEAKRVPIPRGN